MKTKITILLSLALCRLASAQTTLYFTNQLMVGSTNDTTINIKADSNPVLWNGQYYWLPAAGTNITTTNGVGSVALVPGQYTGAFLGVPKTFHLSVTNSAAALNAADLTTLITIYSGVQSLSGVGGITIYTPTGAGGAHVVSNNQASTFPIVGRTNASVTTLNGTNYIDVRLTNVLGPDIVGAVAQATHATNADNATSATGATWATNMAAAGIVGAVAEATHATNADNATSATGATWATNIAAAGIVGAVAQATHATNADTAIWATNLAAAGIVGAVAEATHATNADNATSATGATWATNIAAAGIVGSVAQATHATNADTAIWATNLAAAGIVGAVAEATHSTNADNATSATGATWATNLAAAGIVGAVSQATHATNADTAVWATNIAAAGIVGAVSQATHATNADTAVWATNLAAAGIVGAVSQATHATNADTSVWATNLAAAGIVGAVAQATHSTNADTAIWATNLAAAGIVGVVSQATHATNADTSVWATNLAAAGIVGAVAEATHATNADNALWATNLAAAGIVGAVAQATHATNADNATSATGATWATNIAAAGIVGAVAQATHSTNADTAIWATNLAAAGIVGAVAQATHATNADNATLATTATSANRVATAVSNAFVLSTNGSAVSASLRDPSVVGNMTLNSATILQWDTSAISNRTGQFAFTLPGAGSETPLVGFVTGSRPGFIGLLMGDGSWITNVPTSTSATYVTTATLTNKVQSTNIVGAVPQATHATNTDNATIATNLAAGVSHTNISLFSLPITQADVFAVGGTTNFYSTTNVIYVRNAGTAAADGSYNNSSGSLYTNFNGRGYYWTNNGSTWALVNASSQTLYTVSALYTNASTNATVVPPGVAPAPTVGFGPIADFRGVQIVGDLDAPSLRAQVTNWALVIPTNAPFSNAVPMSAGGNDVAWTLPSALGFGARPELWVSTTGNDLNTGTSNAPFASIHAALAYARSLNLGFDPIIIVRGGNYTNDYADFTGIYGYPTLRAYPQERVQIFNGYLITSFTAFATNSGSIVYTATVNDDITNATTHVTDSPGGSWIFQDATPDLLIDSNFKRALDNRAAFVTKTNLLEHYRLRMTNGINTNILIAGQWCATNTTLWVSFSDGGVAGTRALWVPNSTNEFIRGWHNRVAPQISGIEVLFGENGFNMSGFAEGWRLVSCTAVGNYKSGWVVYDQGETAGMPAGGGSVENFCSLENNNQGASVAIGSVGTVPPIIYERNNVYLANNRHGQVYHYNTTGDLDGCISGFHNLTGLSVYQGAHGTMRNCLSFSNALGFTAGGTATGNQSTMLTVLNSASLQDRWGICAGGTTGGEDNIYVRAIGNQVDAYESSIIATYATSGMMYSRGNYRSATFPAATGGDNWTSGAGVITGDGIKYIEPIDIAAATNLPAILLSGNLQGVMVSSKSSTNVLLGTHNSTVPTSTPGAFNNPNAVIASRGVRWGSQFAWENAIIACDNFRYATNNWASGNNVVLGAVGGTLGDGANATGSLLFGGGGSVSSTNSGVAIMSDGTTARRSLGDQRFDVYYKNGFIAQSNTPFVTTRSNLLAPSAITVGASPCSWTNTTASSAFVLLDTTGATVTSITINGTQVFSTTAGNTTLPLQPNEYFTLTYSAGSPTATLKPY